MSLQQRIAYFILIFVAAFIPCALVELSSFRTDGAINHEYLMRSLTMAIFMAAIVVFQFGKVTARLSLRNLSATDLSKNPLVPPATFRIDKAKIERYGTIRLEGTVTRGTLQKGMGFNVSGDSGMAISLLVRHKGGALWTNVRSTVVDIKSAAAANNTGEYNPLQMKAASEDGSLVILGRSFGRIAQNDIQNGMEIDFSDSPEFRTQATRPLLSLTYMYALVAAIVLFVTVLYMFNNEPDNFRRLVSLFYH